MYFIMHVPMQRLIIPNNSSALKASLTAGLDTPMVYAIVRSAGRVAPALRLPF